MSNLLHWSYQSSNTCTVVVDENSEALAKTDENILKNVTNNRSRLSAALGGTSWLNLQHGLFVEMVDLLHGALEPANAHAALLSNANLKSDNPVWSSRKLLEYQDEEQSTKENIDIVPLNDNRAKLKYQNMVYDHNEIVYTPPESNNILDMKTAIFQTVRSEAPKSDHILLNISIASDNKVYQPVSLSFELQADSSVSQIKLDPLPQTTTVKPSSTTHVGYRYLGGECQCFCPCLERGNSSEANSSETIIESTDTVERTNEDYVTYASENNITYTNENVTSNFFDVLNSTEAETFHSSEEEYVDMENGTEEAISTMAPDEPVQLICTGNVILPFFFFFFFCQQRSLKHRLLSEIR